MTWVVRITEGSGKRSERIKKMTPDEVVRVISVVFPETSVTAEWAPNPGGDLDWYLGRVRQDVLDHPDAFITQYSGLSFPRMVMMFRDLVFKYTNEKMTLHDAVQQVQPLYNEMKENY